MSDMLSEYVRFFLTNYQEVWAAEDRFWREWRSMLDRVVEALTRQTAGTRWSCLREGELLKLYKTTWPTPQINSVHLELDPRHNDAWKHAQLLLALDVEPEALPSRAAVSAKLRELLLRYKPWLEPGTGCRVCEHDEWRVLRRVARLDEVSVSGLADSLKALLPVGLLVDEALAIGGKTPLWRTDFGAADPAPQLKRDGDPGGNSLEPMVGLFGSPAWMVDGTKSNSSGWDPPRNRALLTTTNALARGDSFYASIIVRTRASARLSLFGVGYPIAEKPGKQTDDCMDIFIELRGDAEYQHVCIEGQIRAHEGYDPTKDPLHVYLFVLTKDTELAINSIELGKLSP